MIGLNEWWAVWAPFWEHLENKHLGIREIEAIMPELQEPVLVIGAGQGLIVERLREKGLRAEGVDLSREMILGAKKRRSLDFTRADASNLPFKGRSFGSVVIATGVIDYLGEEEAILKILREARRALVPLGTLAAAFYRLNPTVEKIYRKMGVVIEGQGFHMDRIFKILGLLKDNPLKCVKPLTEWTKKSYPAAFLYWTKLGLTLPRELKNEQNQVDIALERAAKQGISKNTLFESVPGLLPYRNAIEAEALLRKAGFPVARFEFTDECMIGLCRALPLEKRTYRRNAENREFAVIADDLEKTYDSSPRPAVSSLCLRIEKGSIHGLLGPNGAGKTTTLSMLTGLAKPTGGTVSYLGGERRKDLKGIIGYVPQETAVYDALSGRDNLEFFGNLYGLSGTKLAKKIDGLLKQVGLEGRAGELVSTYSTGMKKRLNLAAGLIHDPEIVFLDEPTVGVDPQSRNSIFDMIRLMNSTGVTIIYTTHYMDEASKLCDVVSIMDDGKVILEGNPRELVENFGLYTIEIRTSGFEPAVISELKNIESVGAAFTKGGRLIIRACGRPGETGLFEQIEKTFAAAGLRMSLESMTEPDLESLFLDFTGRGLRDESQIA